MFYLKYNRFYFSGGNSPSAGADDKMGHEDVGAFVCRGTGGDRDHDGGLPVREPWEGRRFRWFSE